MRVVMIGPPGAGKGTQARLLRERYGVAHVSTGDMLREAGRNGTALGKEVRQYLESGRLVPDPVIIRTVEERLAAPDCRDGFVLDGFPRTVAQAEALARLLEGGQKPIGAAVWVNVPRDELVRRLTGRRVCDRCGAMFHLVFEPPVRPGVCDRCGGTLEQREDDREETIRRRLDIYERETGPVIDWYRSSGLLREVNGVGNPDDVFGRVVSLVQ